MAHPLVDAASAVLERLASLEETIAAEYSDRVEVSDEERRLRVILARHIGPRAHWIGRKKPRRKKRKP